MFDALQWVEQIRSDLRPLEDKILGHSYLKALEEGRLQRDQLKVFAMQQHQIISSDLRSIALIVSRQGMLPSRRFLMNVLQGKLPLWMHCMRSPMLWAWTSAIWRFLSPCRGRALIVVSSPGWRSMAPMRSLLAGS